MNFTIIYNDILIHSLIISMDLFLLFYNIKKNILLDIEL